MVGALIGVGFERTIAKADAEKRKAYWRGRNSGRRGGKAAGLRAWFTRWNTGIGPPHRHQRRRARCCEVGSPSSSSEAIGRKARKAGIGYHEIVAGHTTPSELRALVEKLVPWVRIRPFENFTRSNCRRGAPMILFIER